MLYSRLGFCFEEAYAGRPHSRAVGRADARKTQFDYILLYADGGICEKHAFVLQKRSATSSLGVKAHSTLRRARKDKKGMYPAADTPTEWFPEKPGTPRIG